MRFEISVDVAAPAAAAWEAVARVEDWPRWTVSMREVRWLTAGGLRLGAQARVSQPGMPQLIWTVQELEVGRSFTWMARSPGASTTGFHRVAALDADRSRLTVGIAQTGALAPLLAALAGRRTRRFVTLEAEGLKRAAETAGA